MLRKFITLILFTTSVSVAVFGQNAFSSEHIRTVLADMGQRAYDHWPEAQKKIQKSLPIAAQGLATQFNSFSPSAGGNTLKMCVASDLWQKQAEYQTLNINFSI